MHLESSTDVCSSSSDDIVEKVILMVNKPSNYVNICKDLGHHPKRLAF